MRRIKTITFFLLLSLLGIQSCASDSSDSTQVNPPKVALQLHSVRDAVSEDFVSTLKQVAEIGFDGVEFAGRYGPFANDPEGLKQFLEKLGLEISGMHANLKQLKGPKSKELIAFYNALGADKVIIPHDHRVDDPALIDELIQDIITVSKTLETHNIKLGFHNHAKEFKSFKNETFWDYLAQNTPDTFVLQLDVGWAIYAEQDPISFVQKYPNRTLTSHFKRRTYQGKPNIVAADAPVILGSDDYDWAALVNAGMSDGGMQWIVIEQEEYPEGMTSMESAKASFDGLKQAVPMLQR